MLNVKTIPTVIHGKLVVRLELMIICVVLIEMECVVQIIRLVVHMVIILYYINLLGY
jgi:hypothetical protein